MREQNKILLIQHFILYLVTVVVALRQFSISIHPDTSWLTSCALRFYKGIPLTEGCYDTNPPLSILIYIPSVVLSDITSLEIYYSIYTTIFALIFVCMVCTQILIKRLHFLSGEEQLLFMAAYTAAVVISPQYDFSQRDHLIAITAIPLFLIQVSITRGIAIPPLVKHVILAFGALMMMVKPHYGLLPALLIAHRMFSQKRITVIFDSDFVYLACACVIYILTLHLYFPDFFTVILPDAANYYLPYKNTGDVHKFLAPYILPTAVLSSLAFVGYKKNNPEKLYFYSACWMGVASGILAFYVQGKGFYYQIIPGKTFFLIATSLTCFSFVKYLLKQKGNHAALAPIACLIIIAPTLYKAYKFTSNYTTHDFFLNAPLTKFIQAECGNPCSYFMTYPHMSLNTQTSFYIGDSHASRFPAFWFYPVMEFHYGIPPDILKTEPYNERRKRDKDRFAGYIVDDFTKAKPNLLMIYKDPPETRGLYFNFFEYFSDNKQFQAFIKKYKKTGEFVTERKPYFSGTSLNYSYELRWEIYKPIENYDTAP